MDGCCTKGPAIPATGKITPKQLLASCETGQRYHFVNMVLTN